jgi:hypothetical protein
MRFNRRAKLDTSQIRDTRGQRSSGGMRSGGMGMGGIPGGLPAGGGVIGIIVTIVIIVISQSGGGESPAPADGQGSTNLSAECRTGADTDKRDCVLVAEVNSIQNYWSTTLPQQAGQRYVEADTTFFTGQVSTGCGNASAAVGPFYCPANSLVYIDLTFFDDMLEGQLGAKGGPFAEAYVLAHEYGHHVQNLLGTMGEVGNEQGAGSDPVRLELQADCYAGMWAKGATTTTDASGQPLIIDLTQNDIAQAIDAAKAVGDNRIQRESQGRVDPDSWTHGSSQQRMRWFMTGYQQGSLQACDTFSAQQL